MTAPSVIRSTAGFRNIQILELNTNSYPIGAKTLEPMNIYAIITGSTATSTSLIPAGTAVSGSIPYYGMQHSGAKVLTITDPAPRVIPHIGDDGVFSLQVLPPLETITGELRTDKTNDTIDGILGNINKVVIGEANVQGMGTNKRGYENQVCVVAYAAAQDTDPNSSNFGLNLWDFRMMPRTVLFMRDTGYQQEANERMYTVVPTFTTSYPWQTQFANASEGYVRGQMVRGVSQYKPVICSFLGDGSSKVFPFDSNKPLASGSNKIDGVWVNGSSQASPTAYTGYSITQTNGSRGDGIVLVAAPTAGQIVTVMYETT
jgi:hypothetical protein